MLVDPKLLVDQESDDWLVAQEKEDCTDFVSSSVEDSTFRSSALGVTL